MDRLKSFLCKSVRISTNIFCLIFILFFSSQSLCATYTVTNCNDDDSLGSLRWALNNVATGDAIAFNITLENTQYSTGANSSGLVTNESESNRWFRIIIDSPLPEIASNNVLIKGSSQSENNPDVKNDAGPEIEIRGSGNVLKSCFVITGNYCTVEGLVINGFGSVWDESGIKITGENNDIFGNYIGTTASGEGRIPNSFGIYLYYSSYNKIGGAGKDKRNIISGNISSNISISFSNSNEVLGNYIGITASGEG